MLFRSRIAEGLTPGTLDTAIAIAALPMDIRGYGHVKEAAIANYRTRLTELHAASAQAKSVTVAAERAMAG